MLLTPLQLFVFGISPSDTTDRAQGNLPAHSHEHTHPHKPFFTRLMAFLQNNMQGE